MSEVKFKSGKWWVNDNKVVMCETGRVAYAYSGHNIPYVQDINANANLIAAAPEMYEELQEVSNWLNTQLGMGEWHKDIEKLLAKARGEQNA